MIRLIQTTNVPVLIYELPPSSRRSQAESNCYRRSFEPYDQMLYHRTVLEPHTSHPIPAGTHYILMTIQKTVFTLDMVSETILTTLLQNGFRLGDFRKAKKYHQKAYKLPPLTPEHTSVEERPASGKRSLSKNPFEVPSRYKKMRITPATRWIQRPPTPEPATSVFVPQLVHPSSPIPVVVAPPAPVTVSQPEPVMNPTEILSRGCGPKQLQKCKWWQGPAWLQNPNEQWPKSAVNIDEKEVEIEKRKSVISANNTELESISLQLARRFSRFSKMIRVMAWVLRFQPKAKDLRKYTELTNEELLNAQKIIFRVVQKECYSNEETRKNLRGLQIFEDEEGVLQLKSRLINEEESKYFTSPIILPSKHMATNPTTIPFGIETKLRASRIGKSEGSEVITEYPELNTDSNKTAPVTSSGREIKPVKRLDL
ncbi:uncharacterized protein NPIL_700871 [Nephila pilipes]|uniref:Uncharacterized protein n=1 Tax=Nephila pilipes TaxID=299642 RepID=A0A8X6MXH3_NEPPI|nr:uncharacterized protein NPIL_700871 [Nephila pilipes]